jgi:hypothetical protein
MPPQTPSGPLPFFAAEQASQVPSHAVLQHTPSTQKPLAQSLPTEHCFPCSQRVAHCVSGPPQSTSVSAESFCVLSQLSVPAQPSGIDPHERPSSSQLVAVQPQTSGVPPPPQVSGAAQSPGP